MSTLLLLHGFAGTGRTWDRLRATGIEARAAVLAPDLRGHGAAGAVRPVTLAGVLDDLVALTGGRPVVLAGYSQGARIALQAAFDPRIAVERLVLVSGSPGLASAAERAARVASDEALAAFIERAGMAAFSARWEQVPVLSGLAPELAAEARADRLRSTPAGLAAALRGLGTGALASRWEQLGALGMAVDVVVGERDAKFRAIGVSMVERLAAGRLTVVAGAGHQVHLEAPATLADVILAPPPAGLS